MKNLGERNLLIFDCDGVLVDSEPLANRVLNEALAELGLQISLQESTERFTGLSMPSCIDLAEKMLGKKLPPTFVSELERRTEQVLVRELAVRLVDDDERVGGALREGTEVGGGGHRPGGIGPGVGQAAKGSAGAHRNDGGRPLDDEIIENVSVGQRWAAGRMCSGNWCKK